MNMSPSDALERGRMILAPVLEPRGFAYQAGATGEGSGGHFAEAAFVRGDRRLAYSYRHSLGLVTYHVGSRRVGHEDWIRATTRGEAHPRYPGFTADPTAAFQDLAADLAAHGTLFFAGSDEEIARALAWLDEHPRATGIDAVS
jgi:hypothetical protein